MRFAAAMLCVLLAAHAVTPARATGCKHRERPFPDHVPPAPGTPDDVPSSGRAPGATKATDPALPRDHGLTNPGGSDETHSVG